MTDTFYTAGIIFLVLCVVHAFNEAAKERRRFRIARMIARIQDDGSIEVHDVRS